MTAFRSDLLVTTATKETPALWARAGSLAVELHCAAAHRWGGGMPALFAAHPEVTRAVVVQQDRLVLAHRSGDAFFHHPSMGYLRFGNLAAGGTDTLIQAMDLHAGDSVLDATLGFAAEAMLCAYVVGAAGRVDGVEAVPELGVVVRESLQTLVTGRPVLNDALRRVHVVHLGANLDYLRTCADGSYDVVYFDPFFDDVLDHSLAFAPLRVFGDHARLDHEMLAEARRVARRRVVVKTTRWGDMLADLGIAERMESKNGRVAYGVVRV